MIVTVALLAMSLLRVTPAGSGERAAKTSNQVGLWVVGESFVAEFQGGALVKSGVHHWSLAFAAGPALGLFRSIAFDRFNTIWLGFCSGRNGASIVGISSDQMQRLVHHQRVKTATILTNPSSGPEFLSCPTALAFDAAGGLWAANSSVDGVPSIIGFTANQLAQGETPPNYEFAAPEIVSANDLTFDRTGNLWVASAFGAYKFLAAQLTGSGTLQSQLVLPGAISGDLNSPYSVAFDSSGNLWVDYARTGTNDDFGGGIAMYAAADLAGSGAIAPAPLVVLTPVQFGKQVSVSINIPSRIGFDPAGDLWVANPTVVLRGNVTGFTPDQIQSSGSPVPSLGILSNKSGTNVPSPFSITFGPSLSAFK